MHSSKTDIDSRTAATLGDLTEAQKAVLRVANYGSAIDAMAIDDIYDWSLEAYGPGKRTQGILDHIRKELKEIEEHPDDLEEWIDVMLLALNGAQRLGVGGEAILKQFYAKARKNALRKWPDWRTADPNKAIEHVKKVEPVKVNREVYSTGYCNECGEPHGQCDPEGVGHYRG